MTHGSCINSAPFVFQLHPYHRRQHDISTLYTSILYSVLYFSLYPSVHEYQPFSPSYTCNEHRTLLNPNHLLMHCPNCHTGTETHTRKECTCGIRSPRSMLVYTTECLPLQYFNHIIVHYINSIISASQSLFTLAAFFNVNSISLSHVSSATPKFMSRDLDLV